MLFYRTLLIFCVIYTTSAHTDPKSRHNEQPIVTTPLGQIQGSTLVTRLNKPIQAFRGVRYAKPPINDLRFKSPVPVDKWDNVYNATADGALCPQPTTDPTSEDCLFLNVYTTQLPKGTENPKRPVLIYLHAGGFYSVGGASYWAGPQYLLDHDIVLVTLNYRLGTLGFLSTGDKESPGNYGLKDQVLALKWVRDNIAAFGGNPASVTLMGYSAGAASITLHLVSPLSRDLFHKAIIMSGSSYGNWPVPTGQLDLAKRQAKAVNCPDDTSANIVKCLKSKSANELGAILPKLAEFGTDPVLIWQPNVEQDFGQERFLTTHPVTSVLNGDFQKVPVLGGITTDEFGMRAFYLINNETLKKELNANFEKFAPIVFQYERNTDNSKIISKGLRTFYLEDKPLDNSSLAGLAQLYADALIGFGMNRAVKLLAEKSNQSVYYYRFNYKGRFSHYYLPDSNNTIPYGVVHHDDLIYLFTGKLFPQFKESDPETQTVIKLTTMWTNFARTGKPIPETTDKLDNAKWEPYNLKTQKYMDIGNKLVLNEKLYEKRYNEWEKLFPLSQYMKKNKG